MALRCPPILPKDVAPEAKADHDRTNTRLEGIFADKFIWRDPQTSSLLGPFPALLRTPGVFQIWSQLTTALSALGFPPTSREVAILAVGAKYHAAFELYAHEHVALSDTSLTKAQVEDIKAGRKPEGLDEEGTVAWEVATSLVNDKGPLSREKWERALKVFGEQRALALLHYIGYYCYVCVMLNGVDAPVPDQEWKM